MSEDLAGLLAFWAEGAPLPEAAGGWARARAVRVMVPAEVARELWLRLLAAEQVAESRESRGAG